MISETMKQAVIRAVDALDHEQASLIDRYLAYSDERVQVSVWVDLFELAGESAMLEKLDPDGRIRAEVRAGRMPGFASWWGVPVAPALAGQLCLPFETQERVWH